MLLNGKPWWHACCWQRAVEACALLTDCGADSSDGLYARQIAVVAYLLGACLARLACLASYWADLAWQLLRGREQWLSNRCRNTYLVYTVVTLSIGNAGTKSGKLDVLLYCGLWACPRLALWPCQHRSFGTRLPALRTCCITQLSDSRTSVLGRPPSVATMAFTRAE